MKRQAQNCADAPKKGIYFSLPSEQDIRGICRCSVFSRMSSPQWLQLACVLSLICFLPNYGISQTTSPSVIGVGGGQLTSDVVTITWTVGEIAVARHFARDDQGSITEGVHQPYLTVEQLSGAAGFNASIFPNPVTSEFILRLPLTLEQSVQGRLVDGQGRILQEKNRVTGGDTRFDLRGLPVGVYYLHLRQTNNAARAGTYKVVKVNH